MSAVNEFQKALKYLDFGQLEKGEKCLKNAIEMANHEMDELTLISASCCYGDFLVSTGRTKEAEPYLTKAASYQSETDVLEYEVNRAKVLLSTIKNI